MGFRPHHACTWMQTALEPWPYMYLRVPHWSGGLEPRGAARGLRVTPSRGRGASRRGGGSSLQLRLVSQIARNSLAIWCRFNRSPCSRICLHSSSERSPRARRLMGLHWALQGRIGNGDNAGKAQRMQSFMFILLRNFRRVVVCQVSTRACGGCILTCRGRKSTPLGDCINNGWSFIISLPFAG